MYGAKDHLMEIENGMKIYKGLGYERTDVELTAFPECGHFLHLEKTDLVANHIAEFARKNSKYEAKNLLKK